MALNFAGQLLMALWDTAPAVVIFPDNIAISMKTCSVQLKKLSIDADASHSEVYLLCQYSMYGWSLISSKDISFLTSALLSVNNFFQVSISAEQQ